MFCQKVIYRNTSIVPRVQTPKGCWIVFFSVPKLERVVFVAGFRRRFRRVPPVFFLSFFLFFLQATTNIWSARSFPGGV